MVSAVRPKAPWILGVTQPEIDAVNANVRDALDYEARRVFAARLRVWAEYKRQQLRLSHSITELDRVLFALGSSLLDEVKKTADEFLVETSKQRTSRRKRATYERKKQWAQKQQRAAKTKRKG